MIQTILCIKITYWVLSCDFVRVNGNNSDIHRSLGYERVFYHFTSGTPFHTQGANIMSLKYEVCTQSCKRVVESAEDIKMTKLWLGVKNCHY